VLSIPFFVWSTQRKRKGYVCLASKGDKWDERFFKWPNERGQIKKFIREAQNNHRDVYWGLAVYSEPRRSEDCVEKLNILWADLDKSEERVPIKKIHPIPSMLWRTSSDNYQAIWLLDEPIDKELFKQTNRQLTYRLGADKGCWNITRVFRIPNSINWKRGGEQGKVIHAKKRIYGINKVLHTSTTKQIIGEVENEEIDIRELLYPYQKRLSAKAWQLINTPPAEATKDKDRSARLWELQRLLEEARVPKDTIRFVLEKCVWNKFQGRRDEQERLNAQVEKISIENDIVQGYKPKMWTNYSQLMGKAINRPGWLVKGWWQRGSHGMVAGEPKTFKSIIATDFAVSVASGRPFLGKYEVQSPGSVLIIQEENDPWIVQDRIKKITNHRGLLGGKVFTEGKHLTVEFPPKLPIYFLNNAGFCMTDDEDKLSLEHKIKKIKPVLIIFDPLYLMLGDADENSAKDLRPILNWLVYLRYTYGCAIMILHHWNKKGFSSRGGQRMLGSATLHGWVESAWYTKMKGNDLVDIEREFRSFPKPAHTKLAFNLSEPGNLDYDVNIIEEDDTLEMLRDYMASTKIFATTELKNHLGCSTDKLKALLKELEKNKEIVLEQRAGKGRGKKELWRWVDDVE